MANKYPIKLVPPADVVELLDRLGVKLTKKNMLIFGSWLAEYHGIQWPELPRKEDEFADKK